MANAFDPRAELARVHDAAGAWSFIRGFSRHWSQPLSDGDGCDEAEIRSAEQRLDIRIACSPRKNSGSTRKGRR